jgi:hypothetical protein
MNRDGRAATGQNGRLDVSISGHLLVDRQPRLKRYEVTKDGEPRKRRTGGWNADLAKVAADVIERVREPVRHRLARDFSAYHSGESLA